MPERTASTGEKNEHRRESEGKRHLIVFQPSGRRGLVKNGVTILEAAQELGVGIQTLCAGARTCGKCRVQIEEGSFEREGIVSTLTHVSPPREREKAFLARNEFAFNERFACDTLVHGDLMIFVPETSRMEAQIVRKSATERTIAVDPTVRLYYVEVPEPTLADEGHSDLDRLLAQLSQRFGLGHLHIDYRLLPDLQPVLRKGNFGVTVTVWNDEKIIRVQPGLHDRAVGLAVDIGTTTVAAYLCDLFTGEVLATEATMNPQVAYGEDLMSRISYVMQHEEGLARLHGSIIDTIDQLAQAAAAGAGLQVADIAEVTLVGNTVMHHLALNINPSYLGGSPFPTCVTDSLNIAARDLGLGMQPAANVFVLPVKAGYVGADNMAVMLAEAPHEQDEVMLIVDVGTNGEILLGSRRRLLSASSPTGPAFEGAQITFGMRAAEGAIERVRIEPGTLETRFKVIGREGWSNTWPGMATDGADAPDNGQRHRKVQKRQPVLARGICGSGVIDAVAEMLRAGVLLPSGAFAPGLEHERLVTYDGLPAFVIALAEQTAVGRDIVITIADVRAVQLAKAALYTGTRLLMDELGVSAVDKVVLAGAFGSYIDPARAMILGLIPDIDPHRVYAVGNAAGDGARIALLNRAKRREIRAAARWLEHFHVPVVGEFEERFMEALNLPHLTEPFPHVEAWLRGEEEIA